VSERLGRVVRTIPPARPGGVVIQEIERTPEEQAEWSRRHQAQLREHALSRPPGQRPIDGLVRRLLESLQGRPVGTSVGDITPGFPHESRSLISMFNGRPMGRTGEVVADLYSAWRDGFVTPDDLSTVVRSFWWFGKGYPLGEEAWAELFRSAASAEPPFAREGSVTMWRGAVERRGLSWSTSRDSAVRHIHKWSAYGGSPTLWVARIPRQAIVLHIPGPEDEVIVDPDSFDSIDALASVDDAPLGSGWFQRWTRFLEEGVQEGVRDELPRYVEMAAQIGRQDLGAILEAAALEVRAVMAEASMIVDSDPVQAWRMLRAAGATAMHNGTDYAEAGPDEPCDA
jgi:hypothetical protein